MPEKLLENNPAVIAERDWWNRYEKRWARGSWYPQWMGKSTAPAAARTKPQSDAGWAGNVAQASPDLRQVPQEELMMFPQFGAALAERFGAALAECIMREFSIAWCRVLQLVTRFDSEGDFEACTPAAAGEAPSSGWLWGT